MEELSLHILDIAQNSVSAGATVLDIILEQRGSLLTVTIADNGKGMSPEFLKTVTDPFTTSRTTRKVGLGLPLFRLSAQQAGGDMTVESVEGLGTAVTATFRTDHIDAPPLGDMAGTVSLLIQGAPQMELRYRHLTDTGEFSFDTREIRTLLGADISLSEPEIFLWIRQYIRDLEAALS